MINHVCYKMLDNIECDDILARSIEVNGLNKNNRNGVNDNQWGKIS